MIAVIVLTEPIQAHIRNNNRRERGVVSPGNLCKMAETLNSSTARGHVYILRLDQYLKELQALPNNDERRRYVHRLILEFVKKNKAGTLYIIGHRGHLQNEGGVVTYVDPTDEPFVDPASGRPNTQGKVIVIKGGPDGPDKATLDFLRQLYSLGCTHLNLYTCSDSSQPEGQEIQRKVHLIFAYLGFTVAGSEGYATPFYGGPFGQGDTFGKPDTSLNLDDKPRQRRWRFNVTRPREYRDVPREFRPLWQ